MLQMQDAMQEAVSRTVRDMMFYPYSCRHSQYLTLVVSRENIVADTLMQLPHYTTKDLKKPLRVRVSSLSN